MSTTTARTPLTIVACLLAVLALAAPGRADEDLSKGGTSDKGATITGIVKFKGVKKTPRPIVMSADPNCVRFWAGKKEKPVRETYVWGKNDTLQNVFVSITGGLTKKYDPPATPRIINQHGCQYHPHVGGVMVGQKIIILNSDNTLHNVHALPDPKFGNKEFNTAQPVKGMKYDATAKFTHPEPGAYIKCDVHNWMSMFLHVVDNPFYAVTGEEGTFTITGVPDGTFDLSFWHELRAFVADTPTVKVTVKDGKVVSPAKIVVTYSPKKRSR